MDTPEQRMLVFEGYLHHELHHLIDKLPPHYKYDPDGTKNITQKDIWLADVQETIGQLRALVKCADMLGTASVNGPATDAIAKAKSYLTNLKNEEIMCYHMQSVMDRHRETQERIEAGRKKRNKG